MTESFTGTPAKRGSLKNAILDVAARRFAETGFAGTNIQDIAKELGFSRPALYYYFKNKEEILASLVEEVTVSSRKQAAEIAAKHDINACDALRIMTRTHAKWLLEHSIEFLVVDRTEEDLPAEMRAVQDESKRVVLDSFTKTIERGITAGLFRPVDARVSAFSIIGMCSWTAWWFKASGRMSIDSIADAISDLAVQAVRRSEPRPPSGPSPADLINLLRDDIEALERVLKNDTARS